MSVLVEKWHRHLQQHPKDVNDEGILQLLLEKSTTKSPSELPGTTTPLLALIDGFIRPGHPDRIPLIQLLLECGADPNARDSLGQTPLMCACYVDTRDESIVKLLLQHGADPNLSIQGKTAWDWVRESGDDEGERIRRLLLEYGARTG
jgi:ankyrin repeat protein